MHRKQPKRVELAAVARGSAARMRPGSSSRSLLARPVVCDDLGLEKYGRTLGRCYAGGVNLNAEMVRTGFAWAFVRYSNDYVSQEAEARSAGAGVWQGEALPAWEYRARSWAVAENHTPNGCTIKGNVTNSGRIYHMPWSPWYDKVRMDDNSHNNNQKGNAGFAPRMKPLPPAGGRRSRADREGSIDSSKHLIWLINFEPSADMLIRPYKKADAGRGAVAGSIFPVSRHRDVRNSSVDGLFRRSLTNVDNSETRAKPLQQPRRRAL